MVASRPHASDDLPVEMRTLADAEGLGRLVTTCSLGELTLQVAPPEGTEELSGLLRTRAANEARVVLGRVAAGAGVIVHGIDRVLLPPGYDEAAFEDTASEVRIDARNDTAGSADDLSRVNGEGQNAGPPAKQTRISPPKSSNRTLHRCRRCPNPIPPPVPQAAPEASTPTIGWRADRDAVDQATTDAEGGIVTVADGDDPTAEIAGTTDGAGATRPTGTTARDPVEDGASDTTVTIAPPETEGASDDRVRPAEPSRRTGAGEGSHEQIAGTSHPLPKTGWRQRANHILRYEPIRYSYLKHSTLTCLT